MLRFMGSKESDMTELLNWTEINSSFLSLVLLTYAYEVLSLHPSWFYQCINFVPTLRNLYEGQEATVRTGHGTTDWFQIRKGVHQGCILSPCLFNLYVEYIMRNAELDEHKLESRLPGEISITSDILMTAPYGRKWRTKEPLVKSEGGEWKSWLKAQHSDNKDHGISSQQWSQSVVSDSLWTRGL